jgi:hypothetical protein
MPTLVHVKTNIIIFLAILASMFNWKYLRRYWWYVDNSMRFILHICCQLTRVSSRLRYVNQGRCQIKYSNISCYSGINIQFNVPSSILVICRQFNAFILHICSQIQPKSSSLRYVKSGPSQIQYNYSSSCAGINIQLNVSPLRLAVYR